MRNLLMLSTKKTFLLISLLFLSTMSYAVEVVECEDENGSRGFFKHCPPNMTIINKKSFNVSKKDKGIEQPTINVTHYYTPNCGACEQVKEFFMLRKIKIVEKNVNDNLELQAELSTLAKELRVPTVVIGEEVISGFNRKKMLEILDEAGWKESAEKK